MRLLTHGLCWFLGLLAMGSQGHARPIPCCTRDGGCIVVTDPSQCNGFAIGPCRTCDILICTTACCFPDGSCRDLSTNECTAAGGSAQGVQSVCGPLPGCAFSVGPCCLPGGSCTMVTRLDCTSPFGMFHGEFQGSGATCRGQCPSPRGACCRAGQCALLTREECGDHVWAGALVTCGTSNFDNPCCPVDFNHSGEVSVQDIFDFLAAYFGASMGADFNRSCGVSVQDIFDFMSAFFAGCP